MVGHVDFSQNFSVVFRYSLTISRYFIQPFLHFWIFLFKLCCYSVYRPRCHFQQALHSMKTWCNASFHFKSTAKTFRLYATRLFTSERYTHSIMFKKRITDWKMIKKKEEHDAEKFSKRKRRKREKKNAKLWRELKTKFDLIRCFVDHCKLFNEMFFSLCLLFFSGEWLSGRFKRNVRVYVCQYKEMAETDLIR